MLANWDLTAVLNASVAALEWCGDAHGPSNSSSPAKTMRLSRVDEDPESATSEVSMDDASCGSGARVTTTSPETRKVA